MSFFRKLWRGEYTLPVAFWGFFCGGLIAWILVFFLVFAAGRFVFYLTLGADPTSLALIVCSVVFHAYLIMASVGVWRSAEPYWTSASGRFWAGAARVVVAMWMANVVVWSVNIVRGLIASIAS